MPLTPHQRDLALRAAEVIRIKGLQARTREIAEAIGVSEAWLFRHFKNKEEIFAALRSLHEEKVIAFVDGFCAAEPSAWRALAGLSALIDHIVVQPRRDPAARPVAGTGMPPLPAPAGARPAPIPASYTAPAAVGR